jgi:16S rRNA G966 N2-methylase RsmD
MVFILSLCYTADEVIDMVGHMKPITENTLFYGDNLIILREHIPSESVDLIYLDPPFNSNRSYSVLLKECTKTR